MIKAIIFDFGNVLLNLNPEATALAFQEKLGISYNFDECGGLDNTFQLLETNEISPEEFISVIIKNCRIKTDKVEILNMWNSMLLDLPKERLNMLKELKTRYKVFLLSNTNSIHIDFVNAYLEEQYPEIDFEEDCFDKVYYSFRMGDRKPNPSIYTTLLNQEGIKAEETIFIDDNEKNILAARELGMNTILHDPKDEIVTVIKQYISKFELNHGN